MKILSLLIYIMSDITDPIEEKQLNIDFEEISAKLNFSVKKLEYFNTLIKKYDTKLSILEKNLYYFLSSINSIDPKNEKSISETVNEDCFDLKSILNNIIDKKLHVNNKIHLIY